MILRAIYAGLLVLCLWLPLQSIAAQAQLQKEATSVLDGRAKIHLPHNFKRLCTDKIPESYKKLMNPQEIWGIGKENVRIMFTLPFPEIKVKDADIPQLVEMILKMSGGRAKLTTESHQGRTVSYLASTHLGGESVYIVSRFSVMDDHLLAVALYVPENLKDRYLQQGMAALKSLQY